MASLPTALVQFARSYLHSMEDLHVFILCVDQRDRWWDATGIARALSIRESRARQILEQLARANLLDIRISDAVRYRFEPGVQELAQHALAFAAVYRNNPADVVTLIARSTVADSVREFADAFRIKRNDHR
jgi:DNA-binding IclR family transcriptional regulator